MKKEILKIGRMAKEASSILSRASTHSKNQALRNSADIIISSRIKY